MLRGVLLATTSAALAVTAHVCAGGTLPNFGLTLTFAGLLAALGVSMADRQHSTPAILGTLAMSQLALHLLLQTLAGHRRGPTVPVPEFDPALMTAGHALAALLTGLLLSRAEQAVFRAAAALGLLLPRRLTPLPVLRPPRVPPVPAEPGGGVVQVLLRRAHPRRGPPQHS